MDKFLIAWLSIAILDIGVVVILRATLKNINVLAALREKDPTEQTAQDNTSYSRLSGFIGSMILACFLWALGNILIYQAVTDVAEISKTLNAMSTYFLAGSALFMPYGFNQLAKVFK
jgi:hypothetical protein